MKLSIILIFFVCLISACANQSEKIERYQINNWEADIGYSQVVRHGGLFYISGVACGGESAEVALKSCYQTIDELLKKFNRSHDDIIKETIYARDIVSLDKQIPFRKNWYGKNYPAATWVQVNRLLGEDHLFEIELVVSAK